MPDETVLRTMLFDFYGELLTEKQREYFDLHYNEDLSLSEIAESEGISRQGVWDIIRRAEESLRRYEERTGLVARFAKERETLSELDGKLSELIAMTRDDARALAEDIRKDLRELQHGV
jgi:Uncharacterized protein conserved in bacteria